MGHLTVRQRLAALFTGALLLGAALTSSASAQAPEPTTWTGTWATAPTTVPKTDTTAFHDQTIRQIVHTSIAGSVLRIRLSNEFGKQPLKIGEVHVARRASGMDEPTIDPATDRELTFSGKSSVTIPAGAPALSDPVTLRVPARSDLVVSLHLPESTPGSTVNSFSAQRSYIAAGNVTGETKIEPQSVTERWYFLTGVSVRATSAGPTATGSSGTGKASAAVALGDSITADTTLGTNHRWTDYLAQRLQGPGGPRHPVGVLNKGISGNRLLHDPNPPAGHPAEAYAAYFGESGLKRFDRDVASQPGVRHVLVLLGVNDLGHPGNIAPLSEKVTGQDLIDGHRQLIARAHERGLRIYGATITPFKNDTLGFYTPENAAARQTFNHWLRTSGEYDGVIDFDAALRDPADPERLLAAYDSGDHLHTNDAGREAMAQAVPLRFFK
ncbi:SGNH/GDSL hydrolase family protein [Streptomyces phaeochromogenes]|uniref:SGNH/GDSL hydrolase family protein n=1 Tax=Streptomyces phaeochromogenes TaxID=1923 RepID=A0ABZ1HNL2_STRPH|nr:SGNH/GDSL hydrolase family protein [Streptomyces phaeochromogenes]WSD20206.1 SGNH/GDSL hydrolase family protein [Streptomyces phaeochromogenes]